MTTRVGYSWRGRNLVDKKSRTRIQFWKRNRQISEAITVDFWFIQDYRIDSLTNHTRHLDFLIYCYQIIHRGMWPSSSIPASTGTPLSLKPSQALFFIEDPLEIFWEQVRPRGCCCYPSARMASAVSCSWRLSQLSTSISRGLAEHSY